MIRNIKMVENEKKKDLIGKRWKNHIMNKYLYRESEDGEIQDELGADFGKEIIRQRKREGHKKME